MWKTIFRTKFTYWILLLYGVLVLWWLRLQTMHLVNTPESYFFNWFYGFIALSGALYGIYISATKWGGGRSVIGKGLVLLPIGLLSQYIGVQIWFYYNVIAKVEVPYPSWADIGFFGLIPAYTLGALMFARAAGAQFSLRTAVGKVIAAVIPAGALVLAYAMFLKNVGIDSSQPLKTLLYFGYPLGEIIPVSIALITFTLSRKLLGGTMKGRIMFLIWAFSFQFLTEYAFLYAAGAGTYVNGGLNDLMYGTSYAIMSLALISFSDYK